MSLIIKWVLTFNTSPFWHFHVMPEVAKVVFLRGWTYSIPSSNISMYASALVLALCQPSRASKSAWWSTLSQRSGQGESKTCILHCTYWVLWTCTGFSVQLSLFSYLLTNLSLWLKSPCPLVCPEFFPCFSLCHSRQCPQSNMGLNLPSHSLKNHNIMLIITQWLQWVLAIGSHTLSNAIVLTRLVPLLAEISYFFSMILS